MHPPGKMCREWKVRRFTANIGSGDPTMNEIIFVVEKASEGGYTARALGESIFTEADNVAQRHDGRTI
jgi:hypothetical protein